MLAQVTGRHAVVAAGGMHGVIEQITIQIAVVVIIKKGGLGRKAGKVKTVVGGFFGKGCIAIVDVQFVGLLPDPGNSLLHKRKYPANHRR